MLGAPIAPLTMKLIGLKIEIFLTVLKREETSHLLDGCFVECFALQFLSSNYNACNVPRNLPFCKVFRAI